MKLKAALVGLGKQAVKNHLPGTLGSQKAELVAICDTDESKVSHYSNVLHVKGYVSLQEMLEKEKLDFIIISTPHNTHLDIINHSVKKGVHILKEKPFAKNLIEAEQIVNILKEKEIQLMVTLERRLSPIYSRFFQYINKIGKPSFIDIKYNIFSQDPHPFWRAKKEFSGGGCIIDMGYHMIDLLLWYFGLPSSVYSNCSTISKDESDLEVEDSASISFEYDQGYSGSILLSRFSPPKTEYVKIIGQKGILELFKDRINLYGLDGEVIESLVAKNQNSSSKQIDHFCEIISGNRENYSGPLANLNHMLLIEACYLSKKEKKSIKPSDLTNKINILAK